MFRCVSVYLIFSLVLVEEVYAQPVQSYFHQLRGGLQNCSIQFVQNKKGRIAFLGGSITYNGGWRDSVCTYFKRRFPETKFEFIAAGIPSMGSTPAAFRLERDVLSHGTIDLLFEEAAVNDATNGTTSEEQVKAMEGIVRHLQSTNPNIDIVIMHFVDPDKMKDYRAEIVPEVIRNHERVADHYKISTINLAKEVTERIDNGEFTWENDFKDLHPSPFGQGIYARSIIQFLNRAFEPQVKNNSNAKARLLPDKLNKLCYDNGSLIDISAAKLSSDWRIDPFWEPKDSTMVRPDYSEVPMLIGENPGNSFILKFEGNSVGVVVAAGQDAGIVEYRIDGIKNHWQRQNLFTPWSKTIHLPWYYVLASGLTKGEHTLEIRVVKDNDDRSNGYACRIRYFFVNGF